VSSVMPKESQSRLGQAKPRVGTDFLRPRGLLVWVFWCGHKENSARFDDAEGDTAAAQGAVVGRCRFPAAVLMGFSDFTQPQLPAEEAWAKQGSDEQAEVGHGRRSCEGESGRARVCPLPGEFSVTQRDSAVRISDHFSRNYICIKSGNVVL
jgi:hypothetical protein